MNISFQKNINKSAVSLPASKQLTTGNLTLRNRKESNRYQHIDNNISYKSTPKDGADSNGSTFTDY